MGGFDAAARAAAGDVNAEEARPPEEGAARCVHHQFEAAAARQPHALAVAAGASETAGALSYGELNRRANRLARHLRSLGVGPEVPAGVLYPRTPESLVAILAVLKAGGCFLPLDAAYPDERLTFTLRDAGARVLLATPELLAGRPEVAGAVPHLVQPEAMAAELARLPESDPEPGVGLDHLAYVIYTSGSTGRPKGVEVPHRGLANLVAWHRATYAVTPSDRATRLAGAAFDAAVWEVWPYLTAGASVHLPPEEAVTSPAVLVRWLVERRITLSFLPTPLAEAALLEPWPRETALRALLTGGDRLRRGPSAGLPFVLVNHYGPTENSVVATCGEVPPLPPGAIPTIGAPIAGVEAHLVDAALGPRGAGEGGELLIGGVGLARGYRGRPELTAERFVPDPYSAVPGARLYRTGDLVRPVPPQGATAGTAAGDLDFIGRIDFQVKVRGFRIELGEIEAALHLHPQVREAVVLAPEDEAGERRLVGYAVPRGASDPESFSTALRRWLAGRLPEYMVPAAWVILDWLPLTPNGKVDRRALPAPRREESERLALSSPPRTPLEVRLAAIFAEVLGRERIGVDDDFFALGGHSLKATQVVSRVRAALGIEVSARALFDRPTVARLAVQLEGAVAAPAAGNGWSLERQPRPAAGAAEHVASFAQQRLWFADRWSSEPALFNTPFAFDLEGPLSVPRLLAALRRLVGRHDALRTTFRAEEERLLQIVAPETGAAQQLPLIDLSALPPAAAAAEAGRRAAAAARRPFDLAAGPVLRTLLLRHGPRSHTLLVLLHHIVSDDWSLWVLASELAAHYADLAAPGEGGEGGGSRVAALPIQYADFSVWQRGWLQGEVLERLCRWWREYLRAPRPVLELPLDRPRPRAQSHRGARLVRPLPDAAAAGLRALGRSAEASPFMALLAAWTALLARYSGTGDLLVGTPIANRHRVELEGLIGFFVNTLVVRADLGGAPTLLELARRTREGLLGVYAHQDLPFERLVEELAPERDLSRSPLTDVFLVYGNAPRPPRQLGAEVELRLRELAVGVAKFDLTLFADELEEGGIRGSWEYSTDLFDRATIERMAGHLERLLEAAAGAADRPFWELPLLSASEERQLAGTASGGSRPGCAARASILDAFAHWVERTPLAPAVADEGATLSYAELAARAHRLAHRLLALGLPAEGVVAVALPRGAAFVAALLGALEAGGAYLPIDVEMPAERLVFQLQASNARVIVTDAAHAARFGSSSQTARFATSARDERSGTSNAQILVLDEAWSALAAESPVRPAPPIAPSSLAYVIYTSGSTGRPKGVMVEHRQLASYVAGVAERMEVEPGARYALVSTLAADLGHTVLFPALATGGCVDVVAQDRITDPRLLAARFALDPPDVLKIVPSHLAALLAGDEAREILPRRLLVLGGEAASAALLERIASLAGGEAPESACRVLNHYGPTETTVGVLACATWTESERPTPGRLPLGRPLLSTRALVVDPYRGLSPIGVPGELWIGGPQVARGYLGEPAATAERFVPDPFGAGPHGGERLYRTGDRVRRRLDGSFEFLGRIDDQVKIRGFRVEPGEVAAALRTQGGIAEAAVLARQDMGPEPVLVAYLVARLPEPSPGELAAALRARLPEAMIPSAFVFLPALPLTANGKLDRAALPRPEQSRPDPASAEPEGAPVRPPTATEDLVAGVFAAVLGRDDVGRDDDFFALGGHSLLATRIVVRLRKAFGVELELRTLFEHPTVAALARVIEEAAWRAPSTAPGEGAARERPSAVPASFAQQRIWLLDHLVAGSPLYHMPLRWRIEGALAPPALAAALGALVERHEALRTLFAEIDGAAVQLLDRRPRLSLLEVDLTGCDEAARSVACEGVAGAMARQPFALDAEPPLRAALVRCGARSWELLLTLHHIAADGWSNALLVRELGALYQAAARLEPSPLAPLPLQYADFALWQRRWLSGAVLERQLDFWRRQLESGTEPLELPADRPRAAGGGQPGAWARSHLPAGLPAAFEALAQRGGGTPFMAWLALFAQLLARATQRADFTVGAPVANRERVDSEGVVGCFVNLLVLRAELGGDPSFLPLLGRMRDTVLAALAHQDLPFERLVEELAPDRDPSRHPLVQVALTVESERRAPLDLGAGLAVESLAGHGGAAKFDLLLNVEAGPAGAAAVEYRSDLFDAVSIRRFLSHLETLAQGVLAAPLAPLSALPVLPAAERQQLTVEWNDTAEAAHEVALDGEPALLHELFLRQASATPERTALIDGDRRLGYGELLREVDALAARLQALGAGPEIAVGLFLERSWRLVAAMMATLRCGAFYVPLDPRYPAERLRLMIEDSGCPIVLTERALADRAPGEVESLVVLDEPLPHVGAFAAPRVQPGNLAYLIYTSGSTGRPKAVAIEHRSAALFGRWAARTFSAEEWSGVLAATSIAFDLSIFEILMPLAVGGTVILAENALALPNLPAAHEVRLVNTVPSAAAELVRSGALPPSVRTVNLAGEAVPRSLADAIYALPAVARVYNLYGPSEDTTYSTFSRIERASGRAPAIGRPLDGSHAVIVDRWSAPVPCGVPGELLLGGGGLARGYLGRPELTAERFVPDPFGAEPGARRYRTGDLVRYRADGELEFLGRIDHQVKVRGFRIELGEIESVLLGLPGVAETVVVAQEHPSLGWLLAAYVAPCPGAAEGAVLTVAALRAGLRERLPDYMVPAAWAILDHLPRTPNGKVDRRALPAVAADADSAAEAAHGADAGAPRTPVEELLGGLWMDVLGRPAIDVRESFFEVGGHSLLAARLLARVRQAFGVELALMEVFQHPTLQALAARIDAAVGRSDANLRPPLARLPRGGPLPLSFSQQRLWFLAQFDPESTVHNMTRGFRLQGQLDPARFGAALSAVVGRHESLRTRFAAVDGMASVEVVPLADLAPPLLPIVDLRALPVALRRAAAGDLAAQLSGRAFDLAVAPLLRTAWIAETADEASFFFIMHHIISDGWSQGVFLRELAETYRAAMEERSPLLPELPVQYADFAAWQREWLRDEALAGQVAYWRGALAGSPPLLELPADRPRPAVQSQRGAQLTRRIEPALAAGVAALARRSGTTPFMVLIGGFATVLARFAGARDLNLGTPVAYRTHTELEDLIGFFTLTLVLRFRLAAADLDGSALLDQVRRTVLEAFAQQDLPLEKVIDDLQPERNLHHTPLFQVLFALQNLPDSTFELPGLRVDPCAAELDRVAFDLHVSLIPEGDDYRSELLYNRDLFDPATAERLAAAYELLLAGMVAAPERPLLDLPLLSAAQSTELLRQGQGPRGEALPASVQSLPGWIAATARRFPDRPAVRAGGETATYGELRARVVRLARRLRRLGVGPEVRVGVSLERSLDLVVTLLAVLEAGGAYVPLDPAYPPERLAYILDDSGVRLLLTERALRSSLGFAAGRPVEVLEIDGAVLAGEGRSGSGAGRVRDVAGFATFGALGDAADLTWIEPPSPHPDQLAYVLYTSGSTGRPKGVAVRHAGVVNFLSAMAARPGLAAGDAVLAITTISFDIAVLELFLPLVVGGVVELLDRATAADAFRLAAAIAAIAGAGATVLQATPATWRMLLEAGWEGAPRLKAICGGEALPAALAADLAPRVGELWNVYGPTETTVWSSVHRVGRAGSDTITELEERPITLGRAIDRTGLYVLGPDLALVPGGAVGELYIGGAGVARGYLGRPELTAERFLPDPWAEEAPGARLYRTGDLVRFRNDGNLEFVGRADHQVKIRGFRIEPGEVEAVLSELDAVRQAVVVVREDRPGERQLVAYVVLDRRGDRCAERREDRSGDLRAACRAACRERLAEYMVPAAFVVLDELPLTPNGKVDRRALPAPAGSPGADRRPPTPPRDEHERLIAAIWCDVLGLAAVSVHDGFFAVGGDSIVSVRVVARCRKAGLDLAPPDLFRYQTVAELAAFAARRQAPLPAAGPELADFGFSASELADVMAEL
jgi:amino acid adenylation domain-containing protein